MRKSFLFFLLCASLLFLCGCNEDKPVEVKTLRLAETYSDDHVTAQADFEFARLIEEKSNGTLKVEVYTNGQLGSEDEALKSLYNGEIDFARVSMLSIHDKNNVVSKIEMPYIFNDEGHMLRCIEQFIGPSLEGTLISYDAKIAAYFDTGGLSMYTKQPIENIEDIKGLKIRKYYDFSNFSSDYLSMLGMKTLKIDSDKVSDSLKSGEIDGGEAYISDYYNSGIYKEAKNFLKAKFRYIPDILVMNRSLYSGLTSEEQDIIDSAAREVSIHQRENMKNFESDIEEKLKEEGCNVVEPSEELLNFFKENANLLLRHLPYEDVEVTLIDQIKAAK